MFPEKIPELLILGLLFLTGWTAHIISSKAHIPRVTILLCIGVISGPAGFNLIPEEFAQYFGTVSHLALAMVGFLLGESFAGRDIVSQRWHILLISLGVSLVPAIFVFLFVLLISSNPILSLVLAGISTATDPAATIDVVREFKARGPLSKMLKSVVAIDDAWGIIIFSLLIVIAGNINNGGHDLSYIMGAAWEILGALLLGFLIGLPMSYFIGRNRAGEPTIVEAMGFVFICGGAAIYLHVSYLLACMMLGATVSKKAKHVERPFYDIETVSEPFLVIFFILSGISLDLSTLNPLILIILGYIVARTLGKILGARLFSVLVKSQPIIIRHLGGCLLPQAGVAIGMALLASEQFPELADIILSVAVSTTVLFEVFGPPITHWNLHKANELR
ncbi:cation:proton antiporter [Vibrio salinus]|uniref:cation:proton antiporter n=1 Tax=Vibrio salinus TaxID=2899784 RepID=UPI001E2A3356|nr:cation:proton antiporter [Vibrio salinus]MCE0492484.1 cation:proton antiporter [Vibrio salinus]